MTATGPSWILTYSGIEFYPLAPDPDKIVIEDIAHALSNVCRYNGHCRHFYSVAEHSYRVSQAVPDQDALWGLLHDAAEAYLGDFVRPLKHHTDLGLAYQRYEEALMRVICQRFDLPDVMPASVRHADNELLQEEMRYLMDPATRLDWRTRVTTMTPPEVELEFLNRYRDLTRR